MRKMMFALLVSVLITTGCAGFSIETRQPDLEPDHRTVLRARPIYPGHLGIPRGHYPPPGLCRIWIPGEAPGRQTSPSHCSTLAKEVPAGGWLVYRPRHDREHVEVSVYDLERPQRIVAVGIYDVTSGRFLSEAHDRSER